MHTVHAENIHRFARFVHKHTFSQKSDFGKCFSYLEVISKLFSLFFKKLQNNLCNLQLTSIEPGSHLVALLSGLTVCFPVDMRYGWDIGYAPHQALLQRVHDELQPECLLGAPNCRPWSVSASTRDPEDTATEREEEQPALDFLQKIFRKQHARQKMYLLEQPWSSALWNHLDLPGERQRTDQCQFGAINEEDAPILKPTGLLSNRTLQRSILRCSGHGRAHGWLQGQVNGKNRTTMASVSTL